MNWWMTALYDTCSIITLDKLFLERPAFARFFPKKLLALEKSFSADQLRQETVDRMRERVSRQELPQTSDLTTILSSAGLSTALSGVDTLIYATAIILGLPLLLEIGR